jgi:hypothetical protein
MTEQEMNNELDKIEVPQEFVDNIINIMNNDKLSYLSKEAQLRGISIKYNLHSAEYHINDEGQFVLHNCMIDRGFFSSIPDWYAEYYNKYLAIGKQKNHNKQESLKSLLLIYFKMVWWIQNILTKPSSNDSIEQATINKDI